MPKRKSHQVGRGAWGCDGGSMGTLARRHSRIESGPASEAGNLIGLNCTGEHYLLFMLNDAILSLFELLKSIKTNFSFR